MSIPKSHNVIVLILENLLEVIIKIVCEKLLSRYYILTNDEIKTFNSSEKRIMVDDEIIDRYIIKKKQNTEIIFFMN